jgi:hypothetical protein
MVSAKAEVVVAAVVAAVVVPDIISFVFFSLSINLK